MTNRTASRIFGRLFALAAVLLGLGNLTGCGGFFQAITSTTTTNSGTGYDIVYAGKNDSNSFVGYTVTSTGLTAVTGSPFSLSSPPLSMAINPANTYLYVGTATGIYGYSIAAGGGLTILNSGTYVANSPNALAPVSAMDISPDGNWLIVLNDTSGQLEVLTYQIASSTGLLTATYTDTIQLPTSTTTYATNAANSVAQAIKFSPDENSQTVSVVAASLGTGGEMTLTFNSTTGAVAYANLEQPTSTGIQDNGVAWAANSSTLYFARGGSASAVISYGVNPATGVYTTAATTVAIPGTNPSALSFNSNQAYLYITNAPSASTGSISGYCYTTSTNCTTSFTALSQSPYSTSGTAPYAIAFDNSDTYMLALNQSGPPDLLQFTIDGVLDPTTSTTPGRLYVNSSVNTGLTALTATTGSGGGVIMVTTH